MSCSGPRLSGWRRSVLWRVGGRGDEPAGLARHGPSLRPATGHSHLGRVAGEVYRHRSEAVGRKRPGPPGAMSDEGLAGAIRQLLGDSPFHGEGYRKLWARLRFKG